MRLIMLSLLLPSLACASAPPLIPVDWSTPVEVDDKPKAPAPPPPKPEPKKPPKAEHNPDGTPYDPSTDYSRPQPVDPSPHIIFSLGENAQHCTERRENCRNLDRLCRSGSGAACASAAKCWTKVNTDCGT